MELTTGQVEGQEVIDIDLLKAEISIPTTFKVFIDTVDESDEVFIDGEILVVHIARSAYNQATDKYALVKERVEAALMSYC